MPKHTAPAAQRSRLNFGDIAQWTGKTRLNNQNRAIDTRRLGDQQPEVLTTRTRGGPKLPWQHLSTEEKLARKARQQGFLEGVIAEGSDLAGASDEAKAAIEQLNQALNSLVQRDKTVRIRDIQRSMQVLAKEQQKAEWQAAQAAAQQREQSLYGLVQQGLDTTPERLFRQKWATGAAPDGQEPFHAPIEQHRQEWAALRQDLAERGQLLPRYTPNSPRRVGPAGPDQYDAACFLSAMGRATEGLPLYGQTPNPQDKSITARVENGDTAVGTVLGAPEAYLRTLERLAREMHEPDLPAGERAKACQAYADSFLSAVRTLGRMANDLSQPSIAFPHVPSAHQAALKAYAQGLNRFIEQLMSTDHPFAVDYQVALWASQQSNSQLKNRWPTLADQLAPPVSPRSSVQPIDGMDLPPFAPERAPRQVTPAPDEAGSGSEGLDEQPAVQPARDPRPLSPRSQVLADMDAHLEWMEETQFQGPLFKSGLHAPPVSDPELEALFGEISADLVPKKA